MPETILTPEEQAALFADPTPKDTIMTPATTGFLGTLIGVVPQLTAQFNKGYQANQLAIAQAEAQEASALAALSVNTNKNTIGRTGMILIGVGVAVVLVVILVKRS